MLLHYHMIMPLSFKLPTPYSPVAHRIQTKRALKPRFINSFSSKSCRFSVKIPKSKGTLSLIFKALKKLIHLLILVQKCQLDIYQMPSQ